MPSFQYEALDKAGKQQKGVVDASSSEEAVQRIKMQGYFPTMVREQKAKKAVSQEEADASKKRPGSTFAVFKVKAKHLTLFTRQLSTLQDAGLPLLRSLQILENQMRPGVFKNILQWVVEDVEGGSALSEAMAKHPKAFNTLYSKMVAAGEIGGVLDVILQRLAEFMEKAQSLKRKVVGAAIYPVMVMVIATVIVSAIMYFIIPKFVEIFTEFGAELPALTVGLMHISKWMAGDYPTKGAMPIPGVIYVLAALPAVPFVLFLVRLTKPGKAVTDTVALYIPVVGKLIRKTVIARFTRTLGTLVAAGVPILEAITITKETSGNYVFEKALGKVHDSIREGETFSAPLREAKVCDAIVVNMIDVGEETGDLDTMLLKIADNYDEEVDVAVSSLVKLIEPLLVVGLGGVIGTIVVAMYSPMIALITKLQNSK